MTIQNINASAYVASKELPFRYHMEIYTFFNYIVQNNPFHDFLIDGTDTINLEGSKLLTGKTVLDLACGSGIYTKPLKTKFNAEKVVGVDILSGMIEKARDTNSAPGVEYYVADAADIDLDEQFDIVVASYLLCYASSPHELLRMLQNIYKHLKPGGRFITITDNFNDDPSKYGRTDKYGIIKVFEGKQEYFDSVVWKVLVPGNECTLRNYRYGDCLDWAMKQAGFKSWRFRSVHCNDDSGFWNEWQDNQSLLCIETVKDC